MKKSTCEILNDLIKRQPRLENCRQSILDAYTIFETAYKNGKKLLLCGNGGSASDCEHVVGELMKSFKLKRKINNKVYEKLGEFGCDGQLLQDTLEGSLRAISLTSHLSLSTAFANDREPSVCFAQQLYGLANSGDVLVAFSTSGNSKNCVLASIVAKAMDVKIVALTGEKQSKLSQLADVCINVPETETFLVQEMHLPVYHALCAMLEEEFFGA